MQTLHSNSGRGLARSVVAVSVVLLLAPVARGEEPYDVEPERPVSMRALLDVRLVRPGRVPSWMDRGPGKARYGGERSGAGGERVTRFALSQFALEPSAILPAGIRAHAQLNWEGNVDDRGHTEGNHAPRLIEAWLRKEWGEWERGWGLQVGVMNPPFSLDRSGPAWTPAETLTPSALSSWLWEEGRLVGIEAESWRETAAVPVRVNCFAGAGWGADRAGLLLAQRGWVLSDFLSGINSTLPAPAAGAETDVFDERDGRPTLYAGARVEDTWRIAELSAGYFDNLGNLGAAGVWETRYGVAGTVLHPLAGVDVLFGYLLGKTATRVNAWASTFRTWYPMLSYRYQGHRMTFRYDDFRVSDTDGPPISRERGEAFTVAYLFEFWLRHRIGFEYQWITSHRPNRSAPDPSDDGWQLSYRFRY